MSATKQELLKVYQVTLPSGSDVTIRLPNMMILMASESVPASIKKIALEQAEQAQKNKGKVPTKKQQQESMSVDDYAAFTVYAKYVVSRTIVDPEITSDDVEYMDDLDAQIVLAMAQRQLDPVEYQKSVDEGTDPLAEAREAMKA